MVAISRVGMPPTGSVLSSAAFLRWSMIVLVALTWLSGAIYGAYIISFFGSTAIAGTPERWNESLPNLHAPATPLATIAMGAHIFAGGVLLLFGPIQLMGSIRRAVPALHRWIGRIYVLSAGLAGLGGLVFIAGRGTIGGLVMNIGLGTYGALMVLASVMAYAHARARRFEQHRAWAIRLFALTVGSWLFRIYYGFWFSAMHGIGHTTGFDGWFDRVMAFFFYVPNLIIAEIALRARRRMTNGPVAVASAVPLFAASAFVAFATWSFTVSYWGPGIIEGILGR